MISACRIVYRPWLMRQSGGPGNRLYVVYVGLSLVVCLLTTFVGFDCDYLLAVQNCGRVCLGVRS